MENHNPSIGMVVSEQIAVSTMRMPSKYNTFGGEIEP